MSDPANTREDVQPGLLAGAEWLERASTQRVLELLNRNGHEARAVGGSVRNALMGIPVTDVDIATTATPDEVMRLAGEAGVKAVDTGSEHGTVTLVPDHEPIEVTTLRQDVETYGRHARVTFTRDWASDARRRDFTMNALYAGPDGTVYDPLGGYADLQARRVRFIGDPHERIREDYLRILRFFRFEAEYGAPESPRETMDSEALAAIEEESEGLERLSGERVHTELIRLLAARGAARSLEAMMDTGVLVRLLAGAPRLTAFSRVQAIQQARRFTADPMVRLAALAVRVEEEAERLADNLRLSNAERDELVALPRAARRLDASMAQLDAKAALYRLGPKVYRGGLLLAWSDSRAAVEDTAWGALFTLPDAWETPVFPLKGADLLALGMQPGPAVGEALRALEQRWIEGDFAADRETLMDWARELVASRA
ncbi:CCA tRNA nucleotidyltransferase [Dichotomicrobium thermohalophilum]|uniref:Poly(A) polymerase n=1 Tax=Dichotomicrobium thermohalophilum TaxID=933063 RepID=A0A397PEP4_9HYPH|nr:CCA tRNA nucleotidyltransferase [Dichotomicrobium thermohalophilum]RIA47428.1 poly(A) polymerase [Dichotomicrobium thermohalophilum]